MKTLKPFLVFSAVACTDAFWTFYMQGVSRNNRIQAASASSLIILFGAFVAISYMQDRKLVIPAALGAFFGTFMTMTFL